MHSTLWKLAFKFFFQKLSQWAGGSKTQRIQLFKDTVVSLPLPPPAARCHPLPPAHLLRSSYPPLLSQTTLLPLYSHLLSNHINHPFTCTPRSIEHHLLACFTQNRDPGSYHPITCSAPYRHRSISSKYTHNVFPTQTTHFLLRHIPLPQPYEILDLSLRRDVFVMHPKLKKFSDAHK